MATNDYRIIYTEQLDKILEYLKVKGGANILEIAGLGSNHKEAISWLEKYKLIKKDVDIEGKEIYVLHNPETSGLKNCGDGSPQNNPIKSVDDTTEKEVIETDNMAKKKKAVEEEEEETEEDEDEEEEDEEDEY